MLRCVIINAAMLLVGCSNELDRPIKIVLPNDHRGEFTIMKDQNGTPFTLTPDYYVFTVPPSGELRTPDIDPFFKMHKLRIEYADGRVLLDYSESLFSNHGLKVEDLGTTTGERRTRRGWEGSTELDGTTMRWTVRETSDQ